MHSAKQTGNLKAPHPLKISVGLGLLIVVALMSRQPQNCIANLSDGPLLIADAYQGDDPHGPDPHGRDPHGEIHDEAMHSNKAEKDRLPPDDVYGGHELDDPRKMPQMKDDPYAQDPRHN